MAVILAMTAIGAWAFGSGQLSYVITQGVSMNPVYYQGDLVFTWKADSYEVGQIAAYHGSSPGQKVLHRIIGGNGAEGFVFKGDNNESIDPLKPPAGKLIGRAILHVPKAGRWLKPLLGPTGLGMVGFLVVGSLAGTARTRREIPRGRRKKKVKAMSGQGGGSWAAAGVAFKAISRLPTSLRIAAALVAVVTGFALALAVLGWMKPVIQPKPAQIGLAQSMTFAYVAKVAPSPAYDSTVVTSPDPVFRKLASRIDLRMSYHGGSGTFDAAALVTNGTGWHTTIPLVPAKGFRDATFATTVTLDLNAIDQRARAAADAIGVQPTPLAVNITARVAAAGRDTFTAPLQLNLTSLALSLVGGASSLSVKDSGVKAVASYAPRQISAFGHRIMFASQARSYAILLVLGALIGAGVILLSALRKVPVRTRAEIERRYPQLLVHVEPMASPPGKPVVNVDNFPALVKLAEKYGQMILTWRRPDADDFVVRDEGITYRYRVPLDEPQLQNLDQIERPPGAGNHRRRAASEVS